MAVGLAWLARGAGDGSDAGEVAAATVASPFPLATGYHGMPDRRALTREPREAAVGKLRLRKPDGTGGGAAEADDGESSGLRSVTVAKSSVRYDGVSFTKPRREWEFLTRAVRRSIDAAAADPGRWDKVVVHNSSTRLGDASAFDYYHRTVKGMADGLAYHFVIGNGTYSGDGQIEVGDRWVRQLDGGGGGPGGGPDDHSAGGIEVCLVGDFDATRVNHRQLEALDELVDYLRAKVGDVEVTTHARTEGGTAAGCPGRYFPADLVSARNSGG
ncbi:hypothetical protein BH23VER1_BH23VER1_25420 [soil metagenome]